MSEERETEFVTGTVGGIIQKAADKWQVEITPTGSQYAKKCWTKSEDTRALAATLIGQEATFECGVSHWAKQDGTPVKSLWINAINPGAPPPEEYKVAAATHDAHAAITNPAQTRPLSDPTRDSIEKQVALKCATEFHAGIPDASDKEVISSAQVFFDWLQGRAAAPEDLDAPVPGMGMGLDEDIPFKHHDRFDIDGRWKYTSQNGCYRTPTIV
jgi:hypothetical protein